MILLDTGPLVAICDARDDKHEAAVNLLTDLVDDDLAACDAILTEACLHLPHPSQRQRLRGFLYDFHVRPLPTSPERAFWIEVFDWLDQYAEHEPDWADACLAVLSGRDRMVKVWTYDQEFRTTWRRPDGTPIPLVSAGYSGKRPGRPARRARR